MKAQPKWDSYETFILLVLFSLYLVWDSSNFIFSFKKNFFLICWKKNNKKNKLWNNLSDLMNEGGVVNVYYIGD